MKKPRSPKDWGRGGLIGGGIDSTCFQGFRGWERAGQTNRAGSGAAAKCLAAVLGAPGGAGCGKYCKPGAKLARSGVGLAPRWGRGVGDDVPG